MTNPFISPIRKWIARFKDAKKKGQDRSRASLKITEDEALLEAEQPEMQMMQPQQQHYQMQQPMFGIYDQYSTGIVPQNQRVEMDESLRSLLYGMNPLGMSMEKQQQQAFHQPPTPHSFPQQHHQMPPFYPGAGGGGPNPAFYSPQFMNVNMPPPEGFKYGPPPQSMDQRLTTSALPNPTSIPFDTNVSPINGAASSNITNTDDEKSPEEVVLPSPLDERASALLGILTGASPTPSTSKQADQPTVSRKSGGEKMELLDILTGSTTAAKPSLTKEKKQNKAAKNGTEKVINGTEKVVSGAESQVKKETVKSDVGKESVKSDSKKETIVNEDSVKESGGKKSPKRKNKKVKDDFGLPPKAPGGPQYGAVQILKRDNSHAEVPNTEPPKNQVKPESLSSKGPSKPSINTKEKGGSMLLNMLKGNRKNSSAAEKDTLLDLLLGDNSGSPKPQDSPLSADPGLEKALSARSTSSINFHGAPSPKSALLSDTLKAVPPPPAQIEIPSFQRATSPSSARSPSGKVMTPNQQSLIEILQGIPAPPSALKGPLDITVDEDDEQDQVKEEEVRKLVEPTPISPKFQAAVPSSSLADVFAPPNPRVISSTGSSKSESSKKNSLLDILLGGFGK